MYFKYHYHSNIGFKYDVFQIRFVITIVYTLTTTPKNFNKKIVFEIFLGGARQVRPLY